MAKCCVFLGNGFDLDLGFKTKYVDFYDFYKPMLSEKYGNSEMFKYLDERRNIDNWFDLEQCLLDYAIAQKGKEDTEGYSAIAENDMKFFNALEGDIASYVHIETTEKIKNRNLKKGRAYYLFDLASNLSDLLMIFTFNYSDVERIGRVSESYLSPDKITYIHNDVDSAILGIIDTANNDIPSPYNRMIKSWHWSYKSPHVAQILFDSDEIIFFGLSFGYIDYIYFQEFFKKIIDSREFGIKKNITIFTRDYDSQISILEQLRKMGINTNELYQNTHITFIRSETKDEHDGVNNQNYYDFINRMESFSAKKQPLPKFGVMA